MCLLMHPKVLASFTNQQFPNNLYSSRIKPILKREGGDIGLKIKRVPKIFKKYFSLFGLEALEI